MKTKDIEEIKGEFRMLVPDDDGSAMDWLENILTTLNQKHAEELEKAVEAERERIARKVNSLKPILWNDDDEKHASNIRLTNNLNEILQALTPTKTDKQTEV